MNAINRINLNQNNFFKKNETPKPKTQPDRLTVLLEKQDRRIERYAKEDFYKNHNFMFTNQ